MFRGQPGDRAENGATPPPGATDPGVVEAEGIVCGAWEQIVLERRHHMESALEAAFVCCDTAYQYLAAAQRAGDPKAVDSAHATLEKALDLARKSSIACNRIRQASISELSSMAGDIDSYATAVGAAQPDQGDYAHRALGPGTPQEVRRALRTSRLSAAERFAHRVRRWFVTPLLRDRSPTSGPAATDRKYV
jgi:hypothetical protein